MVFRAYRMNILLSNDDGYLAPGLKVLADSVAAKGVITVVAPDRNRSGASHSLTLNAPLRVKRAPNTFFYIDGTPTDCVHIAITGVMKEEPDMVITGINHGGNLGDDVLYSGTVAAATEGRFLGYPSLAVSLVGSEPVHFETAGVVVSQLLETMIANPLPSDTILNVNVPDVPLESLKGYQPTRLGHRHKAEPVIKGQDPRGREIYWIGPAGPEEDAGPGTDFHAIRENYVSVTPLQIDLTRHANLKALSDWVKLIANRDS